MMTSADALGPRLSALTLAPTRSWSVPGYDRSLPAPITHIGLGAFARAHLGVYADELLRIGRPALIRGVSLHSRRAEERLAPQDCLYTVTEREPDCEPRLHVIGSLASVATGATEALAALCAPTTTLVTLTVTEKGYDIPPEDLERPDQPVSAPGLIALALARRRDAGAKPPVVASLDNVAGNGGLLRSRVTADRLPGSDRRSPSGSAKRSRFPPPSSTGWCRRRPSRTSATWRLGWAWSTWAPWPRSGTDRGSWPPTRTSLPWPRSVWSWWTTSCPTSSESSGC